MFGVSTGQLFSDSRVGVFPEGWNILSYLNTTPIRSKYFDEQIIFINAWNEWAEGCHLEPDLENGFRFLNVLKEVAFKKNDSTKDITKSSAIDQYEGNQGV